MYEKPGGGGNEIMKLSRYRKAPIIVMLAAYAELMAKLAAGMWK